MASRCFSILNRDIEYSGDYTSSKRQSTIYKSLRNSVLNYEDFKKTQKYDNTYVISKNGDILCGNKGQLISANSHSALLDVTKGKYYTNPLLTGASAAKYESWSGVFILSDVSGIHSIQDLSWNVDTVVAGINNVMRFPPPSQPDTKDWNTHSYPGFIIDPSNKIFWRSCYNNDTRLIPPIFNTGKLDYKWANSYWKAVSGQPLHGMSFPEKINLFNQETNVNTLNAERFAPRPDVGDGPDGLIDATDQYRVWCKGKFALK
jgi:hypothetical protein